MPTFVTRVEVSPTEDATYRDVDISAYVGSDAGNVAAAIIEIRNANTSPESGGIRCNGSTDDFYGDFTSEARLFWVVAVDASDIFEAKLENSNLSIYLIGYITNDEATFTTNSTEFNITSTTAWEDINISGTTGGETAIAAFFLCTSTTSASATLNLRKNGSTDNRAWGQSSVINRIPLLVPVDGSEICEGRKTATNGRFRLLGWMTSNYTGFTNEVNFSTATVGSYEDADLSGSIPSGNTFAWMHVGGISGGHDVHLRPNGSSETNFYDPATDHMTYPVETDSGRIIEQKIETTTMDVYLSGYSPPAAGDTYNETGSGGAVAGGVATVVQGYNPTAAGGGTAGGTAAPAVTYNPTPAGGSSSGGSAAPQANYNLTMGGGGAGGGGSEPSQGGTASGTGGAVAGGSSIDFVSFDWTGIGGGVTGGTATVQAAYTVAPAGGAIAGGAVDVSATYNPSAAGGAASGGGSDPTQTGSETGSGGAVTGGVSAVRLEVTLEATGGAIAGGSALASIAFTFEGSGGAETGGVCTVQTDYYPSPSGGAVTGGTAIVISSEKTYPARASWALAGLSRSSWTAPGLLSASYATAGLAAAAYHPAGLCRASWSTPGLASARWRLVRRA